MSYFADRVKDTSTTTGTGDFTLSGSPPTGYVSFNSAFGTNVKFDYAISKDDESEWEVGYGYLSASTTLVRQTVTASSNANAAVNFSAGTKNVWCNWSATSAARSIDSSVTAVAEAFAFAVLEDRAQGMKAMGERDTARADLEAEKKGRAVDREENDKKLAASEKARASAEAIAREAVQPPAWYASPGFMIPTTAVVTIGVVLGFVYALR